MIQTLISTLRNRPRAHGRAFAAFTLIELIVVLGLVVMASSVVIFNYRNARQGVTLSATALDLANMIRIAQVGGRTASQAGLGDYSTTGELGALGGPTDTARTGVYFSISGGAITRVTVYRGVDGVAGYQAGSDVNLEVKNFVASGITARLCVGAVNYTANSACTTYAGNVGIEFSRLSSDPIIDASFYSSNQPNPVVIQVQSTSGTTTLYRYVVIEPTGNIFAR